MAKQRKRLRDTRHAASGYSPACPPPPVKPDTKAGLPRRSFRAKAGQAQSGQTWYMRHAVLPSDRILPSFSFILLILYILSQSDILPLLVKPSQPSQT
jgi:hypothetical protein